MKIYILFLSLRHNSIYSGGYKLIFRGGGGGDTTPPLNILSLPDANNF